VLTAYIDNIEMGDGEGKNAGLPKAVDHSGKLVFHWASIKAWE